VSEETTTAVSASLSPGVFTDGFEEMIYWITVSRDKFNLTAFRDALPESLRILDTAQVMASPRDELDGDYHTFFAWEVAADEVSFQVTYHRGGMARVKDERQPFADDIMKWLGGFFSSSHVACHIHAYFEYALARRRSVVPMPVDVKLPLGATLSGVAVRVPTSVDGVSSIKWTQGESRWYAEVVATRTVTFATYAPYVDSSALGAILEMFLEQTLV